MYISVCKLFFVILLNVLGLGFLMVSQNASDIVKSIAASRVVLSENSLAAKSFAEFPVPIHQKVYIFDLVNKADVLNGSLPVVVQKGPYAFRLEFKKEMTWDGDKVTYNTTKNYVFDASFSEENKLTNHIVSLNPEFVMAAESGVSTPPELFVDTTISELLFGREGTSDAPGKIGYFKGMTDRDEGTFEVLTGQGNIEDLNRIVSYDGETRLKCEDLRGTNGERFPPFSTPPSKLTFYSPRLCRPWDLHYDGMDNVDGLTRARYSNGRDFFSQTFDEDLDKCLEEGSDPKNVGIRGVFNTGSCENTTIPALYSLPHFFNADPKLREKVKGLTPLKEKHNFYIDVYPALGFVLDMRMRLQVNFRLKRHEKTGTGYQGEKGVQDVIYPVFWHETMLLEENSEELASQIHRKIETPGKALYLSTLILGAVLAFAGEVLLLSAVCKRNWAEDDEDDAYVTYNSGTDMSRLNLR